LLPIDRHSVGQPFQFGELLRPIDDQGMMHPNPWQSAVCLDPLLDPCQVRAA
jgi:hypothetical protein